MEISCAESGIQSFKGRVESSGNINPEGKAVLSAVLDEIAAHRWEDEEVKSELVGELEKLRAELTKEKPRSGMLTKCWAAIKSVAGTLPTVVKLGGWLAQQFPHLPGVTC